MGADGDRRSGRVRLSHHPPWRRPCELQLTDPKLRPLSGPLGTIFLSMELSRMTWLLTSLSPGGGERMSKHAVRSGDVAGLLAQWRPNPEGTDRCLGPKAADRLLEIYDRRDLPEGAEIMAA